MLKNCVYLRPHSSRGCGPGSQPSPWTPCGLQDAYSDTALSDHTQTHTDKRAVEISDASSGGCNQF